MTSTKKLARWAGFLYFLLGITAPVGLLYVPGKLFVHGDAAATADRIRDGETLLRVGIGFELFAQATVIYLVLVLYRLFKPVSVHHARQLVALGALVSVPIMFVNVLNEVAALTLVGHPAFLSTFTPEQMDQLAYLFVSLHGRGVDVTSIFWGLWLFPFGWLVIRSKFIPAFFGVLMIVAGMGYVAAAFATLVMPAILPAVGRITSITALAEVPIIFWLLIWGARGDAPPPAE